VDALGCPKDTDADGVADHLDRCPDTPRGKLVDESGCPVESVSVTLDVKFDLGRAEVKPEFEGQLQRVAEFLKRFPDTTVLIEGHSDAVGNPAKNLALSQRRADAVREALVNTLGVDGRRVSAKGFGSTRPVGDNATPEGRAANRRVVATIQSVKN
jgi:OOP family OmpA-OmpF porin